METSESRIESRTKAVHSDGDTLANYSSTSKSFGVEPWSIDFLNQLEAEANKVAASVDGLTENLTGILRSISALTLECLETYRNCICKTCDTIDHNIKLMYQLMAKCEELGKVAESLNPLAQNIKDNTVVITSAQMEAAAASMNVSEDHIRSFKDFLISYNKVSELCFDACATDFTSRQVPKNEETCALNCMEKYLKMNQRISQRFQEYQMIANENAIAAAQKLTSVAK